MNKFNFVKDGTQAELIVKTLEAQIDCGLLDTYNNHLKKTLTLDISGAWAGDPFYCVHGEAYLGLVYLEAWSYIMEDKHDYESFNKFIKEQLFINKKIIKSSNSFCLHNNIIAAMKDTVKDNRLSLNDRINRRASVTT